MSWGNKLVVVFVIFIAMIGTLVYKSVMIKNDLVTSDYYSQELKYQDKINGTNNANAISQVSVAQDNDFVTIYVPTELKGDNISGEAWFYCVTDADKDRHIKLNIGDNGAQMISKKELAKGNMQLKLTWKVGDKDYYTEKNLLIN